MADNIEEIPIDKLQKNIWNDNMMSDTTYAHLKDTMQRFGNLQPILVWKQSDGTNTIIDGEHRYKSDKENGKTSISCVILTDDDIITAGRNLKSEGMIDFDIEQKTPEVLLAIAKSLTIVMNSIKGEPDVVKRAKILMSVNSVINTPGLMKLLSMSEQEIEANKLLLNMSDEEIERQLSKMAKGNPNLNEVKLIFNDEELKTYELAKNNTGLGTDTEAVIHLCKEFLREKNVEYPEQLEIDEANSDEDNKTIN